MADQNELFAFQSGDIVIFKGPVDGSDPGHDFKVKAGERARIMHADESESDSWVIGAITEEGEYLNIDGTLWDPNASDENGRIPKAECAFAEELEFVSRPSEEEQAALEEADTDTDADDGADVQDPGEVVVPTDFSKMKKVELDDWAQRMGVSTPEDWGSMKVGEKRDFLTGWEAEMAEATEGVDETTPAQPETQTEAPAPAQPATQPATPAQTGTAVTGTLTDSDSVRRILEDEDAVTAAKTLIRDQERTAFRLGGVLKHINEQGVHKSYGFEGKKGFEDFCDRELGIAYRKARYLIDIYEKFRAIGFDETRLDAIGWSKAKELARIGVERLETDIDGLLEYAENHTRSELIEHVKENYEVAQRENRVKTVAFQFRAVEDEADGIREAIEQAKGVIGEDDVNKALLYIVNDWRNTAAGSDMDLETFVAFAEQRFGRAEVLSALTAGEPDEENTAQPETA